ncbi:MAG: hypothetical protein AAFX80_08715 [Cyanobacteria bacterium J06639_18]
MSIFQQHPSVDPYMDLQMDVVFPVFNRNRYKLLTVEVTILVLVQVFK